MAEEISMADFQATRARLILELAGYDTASMDLDHLPPEIFEEDNMEYLALLGRAHGLL